MDSLSQLQEQIYDYIRCSLLRNGYAPTEQEIANYLGINRSHKVIQRELESLVQAGFLQKIPNKKRNFVLGERTENYKTLPIIGKIAAGNPIEPLERHQVLDLTDLLVGVNRYVLEVSGNSMNGDNICDGDYIICERRETAKDGDIVVALINETEATLKRIRYGKDDQVTLLPSNPEHSPMVYPANQVKIQGVFLGLIRLVESK